VLDKGFQPTPLARLVSGGETRIVVDLATGVAFTHQLRG